jgi:hypothetical protein
MGSTPGTALEALNAALLAGTNWPADRVPKYDDDVYAEDAPKYEYDNDWDDDGLIPGCDCSDCMGDDGWDDNTDACTCSYCVGREGQPREFWEFIDIPNPKIVAVDIEPDSAVMTGVSVDTNGKELYSDVYEMPAWLAEAMIKAFELGKLGMSGLKPLKLNTQTGRYSS